MTATAGPTVAPPGATIFQAGDVQGAPFAPVGPYERRTEHVQNHAHALV
jgi:hypothetical protein